MNALNAYDLKQIRLAEKKIKTFEKDKLSLFDLVNDLGGLLNALEDVDPAWKNDFQKEINIMEMILYSIEDGSISKWRGNFKDDLFQSITKLKKMITGIQEVYLQITDPTIVETAFEVNTSSLLCPKCNELWDSNSLNAMIICPNCESVLHNPRVSDKKA